MKDPKKWTLAPHGRSEEEETQSHADETSEGDEESDDEDGDHGEDGAGD